MIDLNGDVSPSEESAHLGTSTFRIDPDGISLGIESIPISISIISPKKNEQTASRNVHYYFLINVA